MLSTRHDDPGDRPVLRAKFEENGSPRYVMATIKRGGLDHDHDFHLDVDLVSEDVEGELETVEAKLQGGEADLIDIDYISTARERARGAPIVGFYPYGRTVGSLVVPTDSSVTGLSDLQDVRVGVVRERDKNWIVVRAACQAWHDFDPAAACTVVEAGSKSGLTRALERNEVDAILQFWQLVPDIVAGDTFREVLSVSGLVQRLSGTDEKIPMSTFVTTEAYFHEYATAVRGFQAAYRDAVDRLREDDDLWRTLGAEMMDGAEPSVVATVRDGWREMVVRDWNDDTIRGIERLFGHLRDTAGTEALGIDAIPEGTLQQVV